MESKAGTLKKNNSRSGSDRRTATAPIRWRRLILIWAVSFLVLLATVYGTAVHLSRQYENREAASSGSKTAGASSGTTSGTKTGTSSGARSVRIDMTDSVKHVQKTAALSERAVDPYGADNALVRTAIAEVGNVGGEKYWRWYGYSEHVPWCACFASWCAEQNGYISAGIIPKNSNVPAERQWFIDKGLYRDIDSYEPQIGDLIFFSDHYDDDPTHVGIVCSVLDGTVYTVEGNRKDQCVKRHYSLSDSRILGCGVVNEP